MLYSIATFVLCSFLFMVWNNWSDLIEKIGMFLIAHAKSLRTRAATYNDLKTKGI